MEKLKAQLDELLNRLDNAQEIRDKLEELVSVYPFSDYEYIISHLLVAAKLSLDEYYQLRDDYLDRNLYLEKVYYILTETTCTTSISIWWILTRSNQQSDRRSRKRNV